MSITVKKVSLKEHAPQTEGQFLNQNYLGLVGDIEVQCTVRIGTLNLSIAELKDLKSGQELLLAQKTDEPVEIILNDRVIARGELMSHDDHFAVQITEINA
ncbi:FliM/FliN family flagellar motor switch protein [Legionella lytica]|uniref:Flagellar motor switch protein FliN n=1 Tax=Legionella lytica TaxID=96232 RepID=A0ABY4Y6I2_9GAMM|nr:FliM/FliN family flagellar motor switch protein [Legionella lytica]USQ13096.1 FliM/FliN family flagellar motor switch protein [Legionella lytica]